MSALLCNKFKACRIQVPMNSGEAADRAVL